MIKMIKKWIYINLIYPFFDIITNRKITKLYKDYMNSQWKSRKEIEEIQFRQFRNIIKHAYENVPYYKRIFEKNNITPNDIKTRDDIKKIPILTKEDINQNLKDLISRKSNIKDLTISQSGGSTGEPITFYLDKDALDSHKAMYMRFYSMMGINIGDKTVRIWGQPRVINKANTIKGKIYEIANNRLFFDGFDLSEDTMKIYVSKINRFKPRLIMGYVQCLDMLARYIVKHDIKGINPKAVFTTSSVLYPDIRERLEKVFNCSVYNEYGSCELGPAAHECSKHNGLHINTEIVFLESVNKNKNAEPNEFCEIIATTLCNYSMPLIRYKIGDMGILSDDICECKRGSPMIKSIIGRTFGVFTALDGRKVHGYYFTNRVFMKMPNVKQFQMIQKTLKDYVIRIVKNPDFNIKDTKFINNMLRDKLGDKINIRYEFPEKIDPESSGKYLYTKSFLKEEY